MCRESSPYPCSLRDNDLCIILSNALDNAIHACREIGGMAERYIRVSRRIQGDFLLIEIENRFHVENSSRGEESFRYSEGVLPYFSRNARVK